MKKTFPLKIPGKVDQRVVETVKSDIRKYVKRERRKPLPEGFDQWDFACRSGPNADAATVRPLQALGAAVDEVVNAGGTEIYIEILAQPGHRHPASSPPSV